MEFCNLEESQEKIQLILRQTDYTQEQAIEKLQEYNKDPILVVKKYFGITEKKAPIAKSRNQEIYRQIRNFIYVPPEKTSK